jgi:phenylalanyl-tRNA synthetase beta chain
VPIVKVGGMVSGITIEPKEIAGVLSSGMLCSGKELGISDNHEGILELPDDYVVGKNISDYIPIKDIIVEIDNKSLTNRPDLWGHYGIAREIAAITGHRLLDLPILELPKEGKKLDITIHNSDLCPRYTGIKIGNITNKLTPFDIQTTLYYTGSRSISLLVDLTNYLMLELGQPMHAFDARKVESIEVGLANNNDKFTTLDGVERTLSNEDLMIKKNNKYFAIAGVMGGLETEIESDTKSIILESANFDAYTIRKTAIHLGLRTDASAHYEKSLDPNMTILAMQRFAYLLKMIDPDIVFDSKVTDIYPKPLKESRIKLTKETLNRNINVPMSDQMVKDILESLKFKVKALKDGFEVMVPTYRSTKDISLEADLIEEIARIYGYENISKEPLKVNLTFEEVKTNYQLYYDIKRLLATKYNMHEVHTYLWYKTFFLNKLGIEKDNVKLLGKKEDNILRDDLTLSLLEVAFQNLKNYENLAVFEIGTVIKNNQNNQVLSYILSDDQSNIADVYNLAKEILIKIALIFKNKNLAFKATNIDCLYDQNLSCEVLVDELKIGYLKVISSNYASKVAKKKCFIAGEINLDVFSKIEKEKLLYKPVSKYQEVTLDYSIVMNKEDKYIKLANILDNYNNPLIKEYELVDKYDSSKDIRYTIRYRLVSTEKTLDQKDLDEFKESFIKYLKANDLEIVQ